MNKDFAIVLSGILLMAGLWFIFKNGLDWYYLISLLIIIAIVQGLLLRFSAIKKKTTPKKASKKSPNTSKSIKSKNLTEKELLTVDIDSMSGDDFENLMYLYFKDKGYKPYKTPPTGDHGVDLVIKAPKDGLKIAVQCKRYKSNKGIGNADLIKLEAGKRFYKCPKTLFITTSYYTDKAKEYAESVNMQLWNGLTVQNKVEKWRKEKVKKII